MDFELALALPPAGARRIRQALHGQLRAAIFDGRLKPGLRLPASRSLAEALKVSRNTVVAVYDLLQAEGYVVARAGSGAYVAQDVPRAPARTERGDPDPDPRLQPLWRAPAPVERGGPSTFDFRLGLPDRSRFPFEIWRQLSGRTLRAFARAPAAYEPPEGRPALREAIARHVSFTRAVACAAEDVLVTNGAQQAFDLLARVLVTPGETVVAVEAPGYAPLRNAFAAAGAVIAATPVDAEGLVVERLSADTRIICVTPSHQFPLGVAMSPRRRTELLAFARAHGGLVVEDDYDGEFRFGGRPLDALQTLDGDGCVFYVGTFSKSLFPALRTGFVVAPPWAKTALAQARLAADWYGPALVQETLAAFIAEGHLARHVRRMRKVYGERREGLLAALERHFGDRASPLPAVAGLHLSAILAPGIDAPDLARRAAALGVGVVPLSRYAAGPDAPNGLAFGYGMIPTGRIDEAISRLAKALG